MNGTVVRNIHRADPGVVATPERLGVSTVQSLADKGLKYVDGPLD